MSPGHEACDETAWQFSFFYLFFSASALFVHKSIYINIFQRRTVTGAHRLLTDLTHSDTAKSSECPLPALELLSVSRFPSAVVANGVRS